MCRIQRCEDLQFWAFICVRHEAFIPSAIAAIVVLGGIIAALFATHVPLSISVSVSVSLVVSYVVAGITLFLLRKRYLDKQESDNARHRRSLEAAGLVQKPSEKIMSAQSEAKVRQPTQEQNHKGWLKDHQGEIETFIQQSITTFFGDTSKYQALPSMKCTLDPDGIPKLPAASSLQSSVTVLHSKLPTGQQVPCFAFKLKKYTFVDWSYVAIMYPAFFHLKESKLETKWVWSGIEGWDAKGKKRVIFPTARPFFSTDSDFIALKNGTHKYFKFA